MKYNYIICGGSDYYEYGYHELHNTDFAKYFAENTDGMHSILRRLLTRFCFSHQVNRLMSTPFSSFVFPHLFLHEFCDNKPRCYVFFWRHRLVFESNYLEYLRKCYPNVKFVLFFQDVIRTYKDIDLDMLRHKFDLLVSYDKRDAEKYCMAYHPTPMSFVEVEQDQNIPESDIYFCGYAKTRYPLILNVYKKCTEMGLRCDFNVLMLPDNVEKCSGINYPQNNLSYKENIQHILKTKCILEVMQEGADGFTPRLWESIIYDKHLLTNNATVSKTEFFVADGCHSIDKLPEVLDSKAISQPITYPNELKKKLSPINLIKFIDDKLS